ncbi:MAG: DUF488 family protein [Planctomycetes bacterium]|nr:DUF488 family protein [Planctomycetota bacterium]
MSDVSPELRVGQNVEHSELGEGVILAVESSGYARVFFRTHGERRVPLPTIHGARGWDEQVIEGLRAADPQAVERLWLALEAQELPLLEGATALTAARVDLLPHQIVLVHRMANAFPRRFLVADEVGLGKTIETALILRELASRGELTRALMVVPAGLVENWRRELNDVFHLDFEVFGSEGDVTDRKTNAFAKHNRLIASVDTLKRSARMKRLLEAPRWDFVVFDEAHHLSAYRTGRKIRKTENFKLAEALRGHCRDLLLLSATPHQGDHFRFWMLIRLLDPGLFQDDKDMVENRHRLNAVVIRRTKADACAPDGGPLFARRVVHTEAFTLGESEKVFYSALQEYLRDGYNLAEAQGNKGRALGFVMTIFQKIAASSFAAVKATLRRRMLMLTIQEAIERDEALDVDGRDRSFGEARDLIREMYRLGEDAVGRAQVDQILAEAKVQILKKRKEAQELVTAAESYDDTEVAAAGREESATAMVSVALPEERRRIRELLAKFPNGQESKAQVLVEALRQIWQANPGEKVVVFTTYLGSVDNLRDVLTQTFPNKGVEVLKGGDHGAKTAAQKRFRRKDGPQVLICTAAGREGINLQFARILFNHDLPWNPMDVEQRIGRIHRYGQRDTAQVYNLVATDTIEGAIFLLLEEKLKHIAKTLGKLDEHGQVAEDLRSQILGQLGTRLSYDRLYQEAVRDPSLKRTHQELEVAMSNAALARQVVFELFQDLEGFNLGEYTRVDDQGAGLQRLAAFIKRAARQQDATLREREDGLWELLLRGREALLCTLDRERALQSEGVDLLGLDHPIVKQWLEQCRALPARERALWGTLGDAPAQGGALTVWAVQIQGRGGHTSQRIARLGITSAGERATQIERTGADVLSLQGTSEPAIDRSRIATLLNGAAMDMLRRDLAHSGSLTEEASFSSRLVALVWLVPTNGSNKSDATVSTGVPQAVRRMFSIGHSNHPLDTFLGLLKQYNVEVVVDTRSRPYSKYASQFDTDPLREALGKAGFKYLFLGRELGGRPDSAEFYDTEGHVLYSRLAESSLFLEGIRRLENGAQKYRVVLLCSEEDPAGCHRRLLVGRVLASRGIVLDHIRGDGRLQPEADLVKEEEARRGTSLFPQAEENTWKSIRSVSPRKPRPSSSER